jgi:hypothetical protein
VSTALRNSRTAIRFFVDAARTQTAIRWKNENVKTSASFSRLPWVLYHPIDSLRPRIPTLKNVRLLASFVAICLTLPLHAALHEELVLYGLRPKWASSQSKDCLAQIRHG